MDLRKQHLHYHVVPARVLGGVIDHNLCHNIPSFFTEWIVGTVIMSESLTTRDEGILPAPAEKWCSESKPVFQNLQT